MATDAASEAPATAAGLPLPPSPTPAWVVLQNLQQAEETDNTETDDTDEGGHTDSDLDSALGSNLEDSTYSLSSSIFAYRTLHGRTYHSERGTAQYWYLTTSTCARPAKADTLFYRASNDDQAADSLDIAHHFTLLLLEDKLYLAPLKSNIQKVIDIGTGTGIWAIGSEIEDCNDSWTFRADEVDFVHMRFMLGSITDWTATFKEAFEVCKPGGWVESYEVSSTMESDDDSIPAGSAMQRWGEVFEEGGRRAGRSFAIIQEDVQRKSMEEAGFVNIHVEDLKAPVGGWHQETRLKQVGQFMQAALERDYEGYLLFLACELMGWTEEQVRVLCAQLRREIRSGQHHPYFRQRIVYGQKPEL
ncbi:hypothetical protein NM208_g4960 [Fusarium decemcellulare]|uniref:Uncharacterized protein n=1 Tax=Fusarium decemcellulare TaxID=57161 RepID=A0ACC1SIR3_9HYPO|nr:hypothetical protein NM208_g4960 [Fusarium decemcellulare]